MNEEKLFMLRKDREDLIATIKQADADMVGWHMMLKGAESRSKALHQQLKEVNEQIATLSLEPSAPGQEE